LELNEITSTIDIHEDKCKYILPIRIDITNFNADVQSEKDGEI
jgi:hypothetical protein